MTDAEVLMQVIRKAYPDKKDQEELDLFRYAKGQLDRDGAYRLIFSHRFARAFWGCEKNAVINASAGEKWEYHLQEMVLEEKPIDYLREFIGEEVKNNGECSKR